MTAEHLAIRGAMLLRYEVHEDERGGFGRVIDMSELRTHGLDDNVEQVSQASNRRAGTVRGMHYQVPPDTESKTLWCTHGSLFDVLVDLRAGEPTFGTWVGVTLSASEQVALHVPPGVAHGYQTLEDDTALVYLISSPYRPDSARSLSWQDPTVGIRWPREVTVISARDREAPPWPPQP